MTANRSSLTFASTANFRGYQSLPGNVLIDRTRGTIVTEDGAGGWMDHVAQYPKQPFLDLMAAADRVYANLNQNFCYRADGNTLTQDELWPGYSAQNEYCHQVDPSVPLSPHNPWTLAVIHVPFYERWRTLADALPTLTDPAQVAKITADRDHALSIIQHTWARMKAQYSVAQLKTMPYPFIYFQDDGNHYHDYLMGVIAATGDATAKAALQEAIPQLTARFLDPLQTGADLHTYKAITPDGTDFKWNQWGLLYTLPNRPDLYAGTGYRSHLGEAKTAKVAAWMARQTWVSAAYKAALLDYATNRSDFYAAYMLTPVAQQQPGHNPPAAPGLGYCDFNLDPNVDKANNTSVNGGACQGAANGATYDTNNRFHQPVNTYYDRPIRTISQTHQDYSCEMACLNWQLYKTTNNATYLARFEAALAAMISTNGYCRITNGVMVFMPLRDAWIDGNRMSEMVRSIRQSRAAGNLTTDPDGAFRQVVLNTARNVIAQGSHDGYYDQDYGGRERNPGANPITFTWKEECARNYGGANGSAFGHPRQLTTNGCSTSYVMGALQLCFDNDPLILRSGVAQQMPIEVITSHIAALWTALEQKAGLSGGWTVCDPVNIKLPNTGFHHDGYCLYMKGDTVLTRFGFNRSTGQWEGVIGGNDVIQIGGGSFGIQAQAFRFSDSTAIYPTLAGGGGFGFGAAGKQVLTVTNGGLSVYGETQVDSAVYPSNDGIPTLGRPSNRWGAEYFANPPQVTSDEREKQWRGGLSDVELAAAREIAAEIGVFQWLDAIAEKGAAKARLHFGVRAQRVWAVMQAHGLVDPTSPTSSRYAFLCWDEWEAEPGQDAIEGSPALPAIAPPRAYPGEFFTVGEPLGPFRPEVPAVPSRPAVPAIAAGDRYGVRYEELCVFLAAAQEQRLTAIEAAIAKAA